MPRPRYASDLPTRTPYPRDLEEVALQLSEQLSRGSAAMFTPIPSAFPLHNPMLEGGYHAGDLVVVGGVQNVGKTAWILQDASGVAESGALAIVVCYEHTTVQLLERLLCQRAYLVGEQGSELPVTVAALRTAYVAALNDCSRAGQNVFWLDEVLSRLPGGVQAWGALGAINKRLWLVMGDSEYTTLEALDAYLQQGLAYTDRVVLYVDYAQAVPVFSRDRPLTVEERVEKLFRFAKARAMHYAGEGRSVAVVLVAAADEAGLRSGRVHFENLWGTAITQFEPDVALILNRDGRDDGDLPWVRIGLEKNRHGPADVEFRYPYHGAMYSFDPAGIVIPRGESWQAERDRPAAGSVTKKGKP